MKDYSAMSDFEINIKVAEFIYKDLPGLIVIRNIASKEEVAIFKDVGGEVVAHRFMDPCSSWADAGPIIEKNKIDINFAMQRGNVRQPYARNSDPEATGHVGYIHENPLRAAMIVFLMMKESK